MELSVFHGGPQAAIHSLPVVPSGNCQGNCDSATAIRTRQLHPTGLAAPSAMLPGEAGLKHKREAGTSYLANFD